MARKLSFALIMVMVAASLLQISNAQTTHVVGDALGWLVPPAGPAAYSTWASRQTFVVGDILVFNFTTGQHNVAEVTRTPFDGCNSTSPISMSTTGPTNITLSSPGEHYYICTVARHCDLGQKLAINVSAASPSPAPQPATPPPAATPPPTPSPVPSPPAPTPVAVPSPAPTPSTARQTYVVGDALGWTVPPAGPIAYQTWARNHTFMVGDTLVFNFVNGAHDVAEVTRVAYQSCNISNPITQITNSPARITLTTAGEHFYICTFPRHCFSGQQLAINVTGTSATPPSGSTATPPSSSATPPAGSTTPSSPSPAGVNAPPPPNSAASFAVAALPATFLSIAIALLY